MLADALLPADLYLRSQAERACRRRYGCTEKQAREAFDEALGLGLIDQAKAIGLDPQTPAYRRKASAEN